jgi:hypothetical protein
MAGLLLERAVEVREMREQLVHHFDVLVVIWILSLCVGWTLFTLTRSPLGYDQGSGWAQIGPDWVVVGGNG